MANYGGLSYGNKVYCGEDLAPFLSGGQITGLTCSQVYNHNAAAVTTTINGLSVIIAGGQTIDLIIKTPSLSEDLCYVCSCHDCNNPDGNAQRATYSGSTINPASPFTLIGMGYLQS